MKTKKTGSDEYSDGRSAWFAYQIGRLNIGDSLVCTDSGWRVDRLINNATGKVQYHIYRHGKEIANRQRLDAIVSFLNKQNVPTTMKLVEQATTHNRSNQYDYNYIGMSRAGNNSYDEKIEATPQYQYTKTTRHIYLFPFVNLYKMAERTFLHIAFLIRQNQNKWS